MTSASRFRNFAGAFILLISLSGIAAAQEGIPVTDPVVIAKCGGCHARDERGNMQRVSWARTTPEAWQDSLKRMILGYGVSVTPEEARAIVKYLSANHGLAPEEAKAVLYEPERRVHEETNLPGGKLRNACTKCHSMARALSWRRSDDDWKQFADSHAGRFKIPVEETVAFLTKAAPLHTPEWDAWSKRTSDSTPVPSLAGRWLVTASILGHGKYIGEMQLDPAGADEFTTRVTLTSVRDGSTIHRTGRIATYGGYAWRGRSKGTEPPNSAADDLASEAREVLWVAPDHSAAEGRWFWGQYQEFGFDVKLQRAPANRALVTLAVDTPSLQLGSQGKRVRVMGYNLPAEISAADLILGSGVTTRKIISHTASEVIAEVDVAADAALGKHDVVLRGSVLPGAMAIFDRVDYIKVTPESALATFGDAKHPRGYQQFEAIGYQRGADGKMHTVDDVELGPIDAAWSLEVFYVAEGVSTDFVGKVSPEGLLTPASSSPGNNFDVWVVATAKNAQDQNSKPLVGKCYLVVTVPAYTFNGREYVRDLDKWVDNGPATK